MIQHFVSHSRADCNQQVISVLEKSLTFILTKQDYLTLAIPGGRSVQGIFRLLAQNTSIPWHKIHIFMIDERQVPLNHADSNFRLAKELFIDELIRANKITPNNIHPYNFQQGIGTYQKELERCGGKYDFILLSSGEDGHVGALYPNHHSILSDEPYFLSMDDSPKPPAQRMTSSRNLLQKADTTILLFYGKEKEQAYAKFTNLAVPWPSCPAKLAEKINNIHVFRSKE